MTRYRPYPSYKDSGVEWLGRIPEGWGVGRSKTIARLAYGDSLPEDGRGGDNVPVFGSNGVVGRHSVANTLGPAIVIGRKGSYGKVNYSGVPCFAIDTTYYIDGRTTRADMRWLFYALSLLRLDEFSEDSAVPGLGRDFVYSHLLPVVSVPEQRAIAAFLDRETKRIDALVEKKERLVELLKEKRTALISAAVTGKLEVIEKKDDSGNSTFIAQPSSRPMKDSGVEWLGEIPRDWDGKKVKHAYRVQLGKMLQNEPNGPDDREAPYLRAANVLWGRVDLGDLREMWLSPRDKMKFGLAPGDLLVSEGGDVGRAAIWGGEIEECYFQNALNRVRSRGQDSVSFLFYWLYTLKHSGWMDVICNSATIAHYTAEKLGNTEIVLPSPSEQRAIAAFLDRETQRIDALVEKVERSIELLKEYRTALISAAVTGKIDVRDEVV